MEKVIMEKAAIEANVREGKTTARKLKKVGLVPAVVYGKETKTMPIEIKIKDIEKTVKILKEGTILITLKLSDKDKKEEKIVSIKEIRRDPATEEILHADFHQVSQNELTKFKVPIISKGNPEGVKMGGVFEVFYRTVHIKCLPKDLPAKYIVDVSKLNIDDAIKIKDLDLGEGIEIMDVPNQKVFAVRGARIVVEEEPVVADAAAAPAEPVSDHGGPKEEEKKDDKKK